MYQVRKIEFSERSFDDYNSLFAICFPKATKYQRQYLDWQYRLNPAGKALGFDAWAGDVLAAHYACIPVQISLEGKLVKALLSLNTATHPAHQGKGLFTMLAERTYAAAADEGYACIYGIANANSTPGFIRKLGFQLVEPLQAMIGVGSMKMKRVDSADSSQFSTLWDASSLTWRCGNPVNQVYQHRSGSIIQYHAGAGKFISAYAEFPSQSLNDADVAPQRSPSALRLFLGLHVHKTTGIPCYANIPMRLRPSPLNFIYRDLSNRVPTLEAGRSNLSFLDFDAY
jgi:GNAT superfamily N-acetyltransferase